MNQAYFCPIHTCIRGFVVKHEMAEHLDGSHTESELIDELVRRAMPDPEDAGTKRAHYHHVSTQCGMANHEHCTAEPDQCYCPCHTPHRCDCPDRPQLVVAFEMVFE